MRATSGKFLLVGAITDVKMPPMARNKNEDFPARRAHSRAPRGSSYGASWGPICRAGPWGWPRDPLKRF